MNLNLKFGLESMNNILIILLFLLSSSIAPIYAKETNIDISQLEINLSAECEPLTSIADYVSMTSGQFFQVENDLSEKES
jgi:hypothetical protein